MVFLILFISEIFIYAESPPSDNRDNRTVYSDPELAAQKGLPLTENITMGNYGGTFFALCGITGTLLGQEVDIEAANEIFTANNLWEYTPEGIPGIFSMESFLKDIEFLCSNSIELKLIGKYSEIPVKELKEADESDKSYLIVVRFDQHTMNLTYLNWADSSKTKLKSISVINSIYPDPNLPVPQKAAVNFLPEEIDSWYIIEIIFKRRRI